MRARLGNRRGGRDTGVAKGGSYRLYAKGRTLCKIRRHTVCWVIADALIGHCQTLTNDAQHRNLHTPTWEDTSISLSDDDPAELIRVNDSALTRKAITPAAMQLPTCLCSSILRRFKRYQRTTLEKTPCPVVPLPHLKVMPCQQVDFTSGITRTQTGRAVSNGAALAGTAGGQQ
jgi:hypothetical protein